MADTPKVNDEKEVTTNSTETISETPVEPSAPTPTPTPAAAPKTKRKGLIIGLSAAIAAVVLICGTTAAYFLWYQNPNKVVHDALVQAISAETINATSTLEVENEDFTMTLEMSGHTSAEYNAATSAKLTYSAGGVDITAEGQGVMTSDGDYYMKLHNVQEQLDALSEQSGGLYDFTMFNSVVKKLDGNWVKIDKKYLGDVSKEYEKSQQCIADTTKKLKSDKNYARSVSNELVKLYKENQFIIVSDSLGSRTVNGQDSEGYKLTGDRAKADAFFTAVGETEFGKALKQCDDSIKFEDVISEKAEENVVGTTDVELWVSRFGHTITELKIHGTDDGVTSSFTLTPEFNKKEVVEVPSESVTMSEIQAEFDKVFESYVEDLYDEYSSAEGFEKPSEQGSLFNFN